MPESAPFKKNEALIRVREALSRCAECGEPFDAVNANSHKTSPDPGAVRFYFQFLHGGRECISFTTARDFGGWLEGVVKRQAGT